MPYAEPPVREGVESTRLAGRNLKLPASFGHIQKTSIIHLPPHLAGSKRKASRALFWHRVSAMSMNLLNHIIHASRTRG